MALTMSDIMRTKIESIGEMTSVQKTTKIMKECEFIGSGWQKWQDTRFSHWTGFG